MARLADRERVRDETPARVAALEIRRKRYTNAQLAPEDVGVLIETLQRGLRLDRATVSDTLRQVVTKIEVQKGGGDCGHSSRPRGPFRSHPPGGVSIKNRTIDHGSAAE